MIDASWAPAITALLTLVNTAILVLQHRRLGGVKEKVNGMYLQTLADAEMRGRGQAVGVEVLRPDQPR